MKKKEYSSQVESFKSTKPISSNLITSRVITSIKDHDE